jgi:hypothetical protein
MFLRITKRANKDGSVVEYVQLAHNARTGRDGAPKAQILFNFGRRDAVDIEALRRLARAITRFLGPEDEFATTADGASPEPVRFVSSRPMGSAWLLRGLWERLHIDRDLLQMLSTRGVTDPAWVEGAIFGMVANRALGPCSKHALPEWLQTTVAAAGVPDDTYDEALVRSMDLLLAAQDEIQKSVFFAAADLFNLEVDLLLYDTTSTYFEMEDDDEERAEREQRWDAANAGLGPEPTRPRPQVVNDPPLRLAGHSKDHRPDRAQVVVGLAVTRQGIPVRCWTWPGNTNDAATVAEVKRSLAGWRLGRVVWAVDRGMVSEDNLTELRRGGAHYVAGERMRAGKKTVEQALARAGRFRQVRDNLEVKEIVVGEGERRTRYVLVRNPAQVARDREERERTIDRIGAAIAELPGEGAEHTKQVCALLTHPTMGRYLKKDRRGRLLVDRAKVKAEERLDGKYLIVTSDDSLSPEDVALGYKQLAAVERAWRTMKTELEIRPMHHRKADRIRAHVLLCWLALLLIRLIEVTCEQTWPRVRHEMDRLHSGLFATASGQFVQRTELTGLQRSFLKAMGVQPPPRFERIEATPTGQPAPSPPA